MDLKVVTERREIFLEGATFLVPLSGREARRLGNRLKRAAVAVEPRARFSANDRG